MGIVSLAEFRAFDALGAFTAISDATVETELLNAEEHLFSFIKNRGYAEIVSANVAVHRAICKVARVELLGIIGVNPADPAHAMIIHERDQVVEWFRKSIASGEATFAGDGAPARSKQGVARVYKGYSDDDGTRGY
jgi:hypothetical protein